jgi:hypothetical protein
MAPHLDERHVIGHHVVAALGGDLSARSVQIAVSRLRSLYFDYGQSIVNASKI